MFIKERKKKIKNSLTLLGFTESNGQHFNFIYTTQVKSMMYGFGDEETPCQETVELLEEMVINFIQNMVSKMTQKHIDFLPLRFSLIVLFFVTKPRSIRQYAPWS